MMNNGRRGISGTNGFKPTCLRGTPVADAMHAYNDFIKVRDPFGVYDFTNRTRS